MSSKIRISEELELKKECEFTVRDAEWTIRLVKEQMKKCKYTVRDAQSTVRLKRKEIRGIDSKLKRLEKVNYK